MINNQLLRKHHDSPFLWSFVSICSLSLHFLVFWLIQSSTNFSSSLSDSGNNNISVDFVDVSNLQTSAKSASSFVVKSRHKSINKSSYESIENPVNKPINKEPQKNVISNINNVDNLQSNTNNNSNNSNLISSPSSSKNQTSLSKDNNINKKPNKPENSEDLPSPVKKKTNNKVIKTTKPENTENNQKKTVPVKQQSYPALTDTSKPTPKNTTSESEKPWEKRQDIKLGEEKPLPDDIKPESSSKDEEENKGGAIATVTPLIKDEVNDLIRKKVLIVDGLPDILAEYKGSKTKDIDISLLANDVVFQPADIFASLIIDQNGNFQQAVIISIEPEILRSEKRIYEKALNQIFQESSFTAAINKDGSKPQLSNLYVRLRIDLTN